MKKLFMLAGAIALVGFNSQNAEASILKYSFNGIASGSLGGVGFTNQNFSFDFFGDTDNVVLDSYYRLVTDSSTVNINGFAQTSFNENVGLFVNSNVVGMQNASSHLDYLDIRNNLISGYDLKTIIGPLSADEVFAFSQLVSESSGTGLGILDFTSVSQAAFQVSELGVPVTPAPEPASIVLGLISMSGLLGLNRKKLENN